MKFKKIGHVAYVVPDIDAASEHFSRLLGIKHWYELVTSDLNLSYLGSKRDCDVTIWYGGKGHTSIELIQTRGEENFYSTFMREHGDCIHHIQYYVPNLEEAIKHVSKEGLKVIQHATFNSNKMKVNYAYVAKSEHESAIELIEATLPMGIKKGDLPFELQLGKLTGSFKKVK